MARLSDFALMVRSELAPAAVKMPQPAASPVQDQSALEGLLYPIVIIKRQACICFMNGAARRLLAEGLDRRLAAHIHDNPDMGTIMQVRFKLRNGHDLILEVRLGEIEWRGEKATQVSISNVTPYLAMIQGLQKKLGAQKEALEELAARRPEVEQQLGAHSEALAQLQVELEAESAARTKTQENAGLREDLDLAAQKNARLRSDVTTLIRVREELKESRLRLQKQVEELQAAAARPQGPDTAGHAELEERARSLAAELEKTRSELELEARKSAEACRTWETERAAFSSRAAELAASLEQARRQTDEEGSQRRQARTDLEKARATASASEQTHSKLRQELEALRRDLGQLNARGEEKSAQVAELLEENKRLAQDLADRAPREKELAVARDGLEEKAEALARELAAARQETERAVSEGHARELESGQVSKKLAAQVETLQSELSAAAAEREELRREIASRLAGESSVRAEMKAEVAQRQSLEKEITALRRDLTGSEQARSEVAGTFETLKDEARSHADALGRAREELAEAAQLAKVQQEQGRQSGSGRRFRRARTADGEV